jgi:hypothetical protein
LTRIHIFWSVACLAACITNAPAAAAAGLNYSPTSPNASQIDAYLARKNSPMAGLGGMLSGYARDYDIDPRLVVAIAGAETTFGLHTCAGNNAWNWFHHRTCPQSPFTSYQEGAERVTRFLRLSYINRGYDTIDLIRYKYCATGCDNWVPLVTRFHDEMPADQGQPAPAQPASGTPPSTIPASPASDNRIFGVPLYFVFFVGALLVGSWALKTLRK